MPSIQKTAENEKEQIYDYEKDPRFLQYMRSRLKDAIEDRKEGRLVDADVVFSSIRNRYGW